MCYQMYIAHLRMDTCQGSIYGSLEEESVNSVNKDNAVVYPAQRQHIRGSHLYVMNHTHQETCETRLVK
jgi:hypothetical protein